MVTILSEQSRDLFSSLLTETISPQVLSDHLATFSLVELTGNVRWLGWKSQGRPVLSYFCVIAFLFKMTSEVKTWSLCLADEKKLKPKVIPVSDGTKGLTAHTPQSSPSTLFAPNPLSQGQDFLYSASSEYLRPHLSITIIRFLTSEVQFPLLANR